MEEKKTENNLQALWFAAGAAVFMACIKSFIVTSLVNKWQIWVFLVLNLLLLAILFTSTFSTFPTPNEDDQERITEPEFKIEMKNKKKNKMKQQQQQQFKMHQVIVDDDDDGSETSKSRENDKTRTSVDDEDVKEIQLSKEELNERVEAFIAMFRRHLMLDAMGRRREFHSSTTVTENNGGSGILSKPILV